MPTFANYGSSTVAGGAGGLGTQLNAADTSLILASGQGALFPSVFPFSIQLGALTGAVFELVRCTARSADTLTIVRAQEGTTARIWVVGSVVTQVATAGNFSNLQPIFHMGDYGAVGDGVTNDWPAFNAAVNAASASPNGGIVQFGAKTYFLNMPTSSAQVSTNPVTLQGVDRAVSKIVTQTGPLTANTSLLNCLAGTSITINDLTITGPSNPTGNGALGWTSWLIYHNGTSGLVSIHRLTTTNFTQPITILDGASLSVYVYESSINGNSSIVSTMTNTVALISIGATLYARVVDVVFNTFGVPTTNQGHCIYVHQSVNFEARGCQFSNNLGNGYCIHMYNSSGTSPNAAVANCYFDSTSGRAIITNQTVRTRISDCRIGGAAQYGVTCQFDVDITDCQFFGAFAGFNPIAQLGGLASVIRVRDSDFLGLPATGTFAINEAVANSVVRIDGCSFSCNIAWAITSTGGIYFLSPTCDFADEGYGHLSIRDNQAAPVASNPATNVTVNSVTGDDARGFVVFSVATANIPANTRICTLTFNKTYGQVPLVLVGNMSNGLYVGDYNVTGVLVTTFDIFCTGIVQIGANLRIGYLVIG